MFSNQHGSSEFPNVGKALTRRRLRLSFAMIVTSLIVTTVVVGGDGISTGQPKSAAALDSTFVPRLIAGGGLTGHGSDGQLAACPTLPGCATTQSGRILYPIGMAIHPVSGEFFYSQGANDVNDLTAQYASLRRIAPGGILQTVIGDGGQTSSCSSSCDGAVNTSTQQLRSPGHMVFNPEGTKLLVLDGYNGIREVTFTGTPAVPATISTLTHSQIPVSINSMAQVLHTGGLAMDSTGALYFGGRVLDQTMQSLLRLSVFKRTAAGVVTEIVSSNGTASGAPTQKQGLDMYSGPRDIKVVGTDVYILYENKLIRTDLSGNLEAEYTLTNTVQARSVAVLDSTIYVGLTAGGRVVTFPDNAPTTAAVTPTQTARFGTSANETFAIGNTQASVELTGPRSMMVNNGSLYISDMTSGFSTIIGIETPPDVTSPVLQSATLASTGSAIALVFDEALDAGSIPANSSFSVSVSGVTRNISSVLVSGSTATLTVAGTEIDSAAVVGVSYSAPVQTPLQDSAGNDVASFSNSSVSNSSTVTTTTSTTTTTTTTAPVVITTTLPAVTTTIVAPTTTTTTTTTTVPAGAPVLVTAANQAQLEAAPGAAVAVINGKAVEVETVKVEATATPEALQQAAKNIVSDISSVLPSGVKNPIAVVNTPDGAELTGLMVNPDDPTEKLSVPVDSVTLIKAGDSRVLISALNQTNLPGEVAPGGVLQVTRGGYVAAQAFGLPGSETGEIVLMSSPRLLQTFTVNANGSFNGQVALPKDISFGSHTVVMATKSAKVSLGIKLVRTRMQFRIKRVMGTTIFKNRAKVVKRGGGVVTITGAGRCKANSTRVVMAAKPGPCYITVKQTAKGANKAIYYRFTVAVLKKLPKKK